MSTSAKVSLATWNWDNQMALRTPIRMISLLRWYWCNETIFLANNTIWWTILLGRESCHCIKNKWLTRDDVISGKRECFGQSFHVSLASNMVRYFEITAVSDRVFPNIEQVRQPSDFTLVMLTAFSTGYNAEYWGITPPTAPPYVNQHFFRGMT